MRCQARVADHCVYLSYAKVKECRVVTQNTPMPISSVGFAKLAFASKMHESLF